jgi:hypothetical protein
LKNEIKKKKNATEVFRRAKVSNKQLLFVFQKRKRNTKPVPKYLCKPIGKRKKSMKFYTNPKKEQKKTK